MVEAQTSAQTGTVPGMLPSLAACRQARMSRDQRFDGRFFIGVVTTGVYCRPICPARLPKEDNVRYYACAAAAQDAGFRPCLRCRPEAALRIPEWTLAGDTVLRGLRLIEAGYLNEHSSGELAGQLNLSERHLNRLFAAELGTSPKSLARLTRAGLAREIMTSTRMHMADVAYHSGYGSLSRFNHEIRQVYDCTPSELRGRGAHRTAMVEVKLPVRLPYDVDWMFGYLQKRALFGIEQVDCGPGRWRYQRLLEGGEGEEQWLEITMETSLQGEQHDNAQCFLLAKIPLIREPLHSLIHRVRRLFDLHADGHSVNEFLGADDYLSGWVERAPGLRVPGAWDGFETSVRAVLGQQVSVARGTQLANRMVERFGSGRFPGAGQLRGRDIAVLGMPGRRGRAVAELAELAEEGELHLDETQAFEELQARLEAIEGIGPWTANYIRMRVLKDPDAFPANDWIVLKELECTAAAARRRAQAWRPWRAYALMYIWYAAGWKRAVRASTATGRR